MKKYVSILLVVILSTSLLAGCGGYDKPGQKPAEESKEQAAQPEEKEAAQPEEKEAAGTEADAAQADAAGDDAQAATDTSADSGAYVIYVMDEETMDPIPGVNVQFCSDTMCRMGKTDEGGSAAFDSDPGTYTVHLMNAPDGYEKCTEELTLDKDNREAVFLLTKQETESESAADSDDTGSTDSDSEMDFPLTGFTFNAPEKFKELSGEIRTRDNGEVEADSGVVIGYVAYQAKTAAEFLEYFETLGIDQEGELSDDDMDKITSFYSDSPNLILFRVMGVRGDQDTDELNKKMFSFPVLVFDEIGTAGDYKFYYVVLDDADYYEELRNTDYPQDKLEEAYNLWQEAATTDDFKEQITVKEPVSPYAQLEEGAPVSFETTDLDGNPVTSEELFAGHKITMINIWATWCTYCKKEMEQLEALNKEWADKGCQIIGICDDAEDDEMILEAKKVLEAHGVTYRNVCMTEELREMLPAIGLPTSYFVDSEGKILCKPVNGAYVEQYKETLEELLSEMELSPY